MFVAGQRDMQRMDQYTMERLGLPGVVLMENAGARVVEEIIQHPPGERQGERPLHARWLLQVSCMPKQEKRVRKCIHVTV